jgi:hypothetical protein
MSDTSDVKPQGVVETITRVAMFKKYLPYVIAAVGWLVVAIPYITGRSDTPPPAPPVLPQVQPAAPLVIVVGQPATVQPVAVAAAK